MTSHRHRLGRVVVGCLLVSPLLVDAAARQGAPAPAPPAAAPPPESVAPPAALPAVVARVNGEEIPAGEVETAIAQLEARAGRSVPPDQRDRVVRGVLEQLITYRLLAQESATRKVAVSDAEVDGQLAEIRSQFPSEEAFQSALQEQKVTPDGLRDSVRRGLQIRGLLDAEVATAPPVSADEVNAFYASNNFRQNERVRASHILVSVPEGADAAARDQARTRADELLRQVRAGSDFADLAKQHSQDPGSAPGGGDLGYFERGQMVGPFEEAAFALTPGGTSDLVETRFGFHIIRVADRQAERTIPLEEVRGRIEEHLREQQREQRTEALIDALRAKAKVDILM